MDCFEAHKYQLLLSDKPDTRKLAVLVRELDAISIFRATPHMVFMEKITFSFLFFWSSQVGKLSYSQ